MFIISVKKNYFKEESLIGILPFLPHSLYLQGFVFLRNEESRKIVELLIYKNYYYVKHFEKILFAKRDRCRCSI